MPSSFIQSKERWLLLGGGSDGTDTYWNRETHKKNVFADAATGFFVLFQSKTTLVHQA